MIKFKKKNLSKSSKEWIARQSSDHYSSKARLDGYRSRAVYKLDEINKKLNIINPNANILDLGSAPGGWSQYLIKKKCKNVVAVDLLDMEPIPQVSFIKGDFNLKQIHSKIKNAFNGNIDIILSDIACNTTGNKNLDSYKTNSITLEVLNYGVKVLNNKGCILAKYFNGDLDKQILEFAKQNYNKFKIIKPKASRSDSKEMYLFCSLN